MIIKKKRINSLSCLSHVEDGKNLVMALCDAMRFKDVLLKLGFSEDLAEGERILPSMLNPTMKRNAEPFHSSNVYFSLPFTDFMVDSTRMGRSWRDKRGNGFC